MAAEGTASGGGSKGKSTRKTVICTETEVRYKRYIIGIESNIEDLRSIALWTLILIFRKLKFYRFKCKG